MTDQAIVIETGWDTRMGLYTSVRRVPWHQVRDFGFVIVT